MKWLLDQGLPRSAVTLLTNRGMDSIHVGAIGMAAASDPEILVRARHDHRIVVTLDADFHALLALSGATIYWFWIGAHDEYEHIIQSM